MAENTDTGVGPGRRSSDWPRRVGDTVLAVALLVVLAGIGAWLFLYVGMTGWAATGTAGAASAVDEAEREALLTAAVVLAASLGVAVLCLRRRLWVTGVSQAFVVAVAGLLLLGGLAQGLGEDRRGTAPTSHYDGPGRPCLSGGGSDECRGSGG
jgi:hypothetical protein